MLNLVQDNITPEDNNKSSVIKTPTIICSVMDWKNMDREEAVQKDCAERKKLLKPFGSKNKYVWVGIGVATSRS
tara:strand:+ start:308 stop:529 length:222 start_codon:yes stop_codon:yes gene_type:complete